MGVKLKCFYEREVVERQQEQEEQEQEIALPAMELEAAACLLQAIARMRGCQKQLKKLRKRDAHRNQVVGEILSTEQLYVANLRVVVGVFLNPLRSTVSGPEPLCTSEELKRIFSNVEAIYALNNNLLQSISARIDAWSPTQCLGDVFLQMAPYLKMYTEYCNNYECALASLTECMEMDNFKLFIDICSSFPETSNLTFVSFLIMPVQRIPRYRLLLTDLLKHTNEEHPDHEALTKAVRQMEEVANYVNYQMKLQQSMKAITRIIDEIGAEKDLYKVDRIFVKEGRVKQATSGKGVRKIFLYLFSDCLVLAVKLGEGLLKKKQFCYWRTIELPGCWAVPANDGISIKNIFNLVICGESLTFFADSNKARDDWISTINDTVDKLYEKCPEKRREKFPYIVDAKLEQKLKQMVDDDDEDSELPPMPKGGTLGRKFGLNEGGRRSSMASSRRASVMPNPRASVFPDKPLPAIPSKAPKRPLLVFPQQAVEISGGSKRVRASTPTLDIHQMAFTVQPAPEVVQVVSAPTRKLPQPPKQEEKEQEYEGEGEAEEEDVVAIPQAEEVTVAAVQVVTPPVVLGGQQEPMAPPAVDRSRKNVGEGVGPLAMDSVQTVTPAHPVLHAVSPRRHVPVTVVSPRRIPPPTPPKSDEMLAMAAARPTRALPTPSAKDLPRPPTGDAAGETRGGGGGGGVGQPPSVPYRRSMMLSMEKALSGVDAAQSPSPAASPPPPAGRASPSDKNRSTFVQRVFANSRDSFKFAQAPLAVPSDMPVMMEGQLYKKGKINRAWRRRYFRLVAGSLFYFKSISDPAAIGVIPLTDGDARLEEPVPAATRDNAFQLMSNGKPFLLAADTADLKAEWVQWIEQHLPV